MAEASIPAKYGFLDESGNTRYGSTDSRFLIVSLVVVGYPERLRKAVTKTRKSLGKRLRDLPELKAATGDPRVVHKLLGRAVEIGFDAVAVILDKNSFPQPLEPEDLYRYACSTVVRAALERCGPLSLILDKRYKTDRQRQQLEQAIRTGVEDADMIRDILHEESHKERVLQVADAVCWSLFQRYERGNEEFWEVIRERVIEVKL